MVTLRLVARSVKLAPQARRLAVEKLRSAEPAAGGFQLPTDLPKRPTLRLSDSDSQTQTPSLAGHCVDVLLGDPLRDALGRPKLARGPRHGQGQAAEAAEGMAGGRAGALNHLRSQSRQPGAWRPCRSGLPR